MKCIESLFVLTKCSVVDTFFSLRFILKLCVVMMNVQLYSRANTPLPPQKNQLQNIPNHVVKLLEIPGLVKPTVVTLWSD